MAECELSDQAVDTEARDKHCVILVEVDTGYMSLDRDCAGKNTLFVVDAGGGLGWCRVSVDSEMLGRAVRLRLDSVPVAAGVPAKQESHVLRAPWTGSWRWMSWD